LARAPNLGGHADFRRWHMSVVQTHPPQLRPAASPSKLGL